MEENGEKGEALRGSMTARHAGEEGRVVVVEDDDERTAESREKRRFHPSAQESRPNTLHKTSREMIYLGGEFNLGLLALLCTDF